MSGAWKLVPSSPLASDKFAKGLQMGHESVLVIGADALDQLSKFQRPDYAAPGNRHFVLIDQLEEMKNRFAMQGEELSFLDWVIKQPVQLLAEGEQPDLVGLVAFHGRHREGWYRINADQEVVELVKRTIPGGIWDFYEMTENCLLLKPGAVGASDDSGCGHEEPAEGYAGIARKRDIDFVGMRDAAGRKAAELWDAAAQSRSNMGWLSLPREEYIQMARDSALLAEKSEVVRDGELMHVPNRDDTRVSTLSLREQKARHDAWFREFNTMLDSLPDDTLFTAAQMHS
jgi:hypothetical protein